MQSASRRDFCFGPALDRDMLHIKKNNFANSAIDQLNRILIHERRRSALPWGKFAQIVGKPLLILIDADSLSDQEISNKIKTLASQGLPLDIKVCANRSLESAEVLTIHTLEKLELISPLKFKTVLDGANKADLWLIQVGDEALSDPRFDGVIVLTQDRDLFPVLERWRASSRAAFISPLRLDESGRHLVRRCDKIGFSVIDCSFNLITKESL